MSSDGKRLAIYSQLGPPCIWEISRAKKVMQLGEYPRAGRSGPTIAFSPDGQFVVTGAYIHEVEPGGGELWDLDTGTRHKLPNSTGGLHPVAFSPNGKWVAAGTRSDGIKIWDTANHRSSLLIKGDFLVRALVLSPDGRMMASTGVENTIHLWEGIHRKRAGADLVGHPGLGLVAAFHPSGEILATGGFDTKVLLWDVGSGSAECRLPRPPREICSAGGLSLRETTQLKPFEPWETWCYPKPRLLLFCNLDSAQSM